MRINSRIVFRKEPDHTGLLFDPDTGNVFCLNPTGMLLYDALKQEQTEESLLALLEENCTGFDRTRGAAEVQAFLTQLRAKGFLSDDDPGR